MFRRLNYYRHECIVGNADPCRVAWGWRGVVQIGRSTCIFPSHKVTQGHTQGQATDVPPMIGHFLLVISHPCPYSTVVVMARGIRPSLANCTQTNAQIREPCSPRSPRLLAGNFRLCEWPIPSRYVGKGKERKCSQSIGFVRSAGAGAGAALRLLLSHDQTCKRMRLQRRGCE